MRSLDTNVLARFILKDDAQQTPLAEIALQQQCFIADTVFLELAWLLSSIFGMDRPDLGLTLLDLVALPEVTVSDSSSLIWAVERFLAGADLADMIHIIGSSRADSFATFERKLDRLAGPSAPLPIEQLT